MFLLIFLIMSDFVLLCFRIPPFTRKALQQVDDSPNAETGTESYYEGLQYGDCAVESKRLNIWYL